MRIYQINEDDLAELERILPGLIELASDRMQTVHRKQWEKVKAIVSNVRWNYGPHSDVKRIEDAGDAA